MPTSTYKLSPSSFKFLWKQCRHCYYRQIKHGIAPPSGAFPAIFTKMNSLLQGDIVGHNLQELHPDLPNAIVQKTEGTLKSAPILGSENCYIYGRYDIICRLEDGSLMVVDFKISDPSDGTLAGYSTQLHAYKYALENPANPDQTPEKVTQMGIITVTPSEIKLVKGRIVFVTNPKWHPFPIDMDAFYTFINEISVTLDGETPEPNDSCIFCKYRERTQE